MTNLLHLLLAVLLSSVPALAVGRVATSANVVALTFDACATKTQANGFDAAVLDILQRQQVPATVFLSGRWIEAHADAARALAAAPLLELGNHTYNHPRLRSLSSARMKDEIAHASRLVESLGQHPTALRPPAGDFDARVVRAARAAGLSTVLWDVVSGDAGGHVPATEMVESVTRDVRPGSIVIFHINGRAPFTRDALPQIIDRLRARGVRFVTVSELLALPDARIVPASQDVRVPEDRR